MYDFCLKDDGKMSEFFQQYQDFLNRWRATKPATARPLRDCSSGTSAEKKRILFEKRGLSPRGDDPFLMGQRINIPASLIQSGGVNLRQKTGYSPIFSTYSSKHQPFCVMTAAASLPT